MVQIFFSLRFQSQLRRTRPRLLRELEASIIKTIEGFGGAVRMEHKLITAAFNSGTIGFWLDILCVLEGVKHALEKAASELYGHVCLVGRDIPEEDIPPLIRALPFQLWGTGIWCAPEVRNALESFVDFEESAEENGYAQIRAIRELGIPGLSPGEGMDNADKICQYLKQGNVRNTVIVGEENTGKREGLRRYCAAQMKDFPPLVIHFGSGEEAPPKKAKEKALAESGAVNTVTAIGDALNPEVQQVLGQDENTAELESLGKILFRERLRDELSDYIVKRGERFLSLLIESYRSAAVKKGAKPALILENIQAADPLSRMVIMGIYSSFPSRERVPVYGTCASLEALGLWEEIFPRIIKFTPEKTAEQTWPEIPLALWEMAYCCRLFKRYFPPPLLSQLFREEGKNPLMIDKALAILAQIPVLDNPGFIRKVERILGGEAEAVRRVVRGRLLAWVGDFRLKPCYRLLHALFVLGGSGNEDIVLEAICADIINGTYRAIDEAIREGTFASVVGEERAGALLYIVKTQKALNHGGKDEICEAFQEPLPPLAGYPGFRARMFTNTAAYHLGLCDSAAAAEAVKAAMLLTQNETGGRGLAQVYRLFSLVEFTNHQLSEAIDYFSFAVENAEKSENHAELGISAFYSAGAHFLFGNLSKARRLAIRAQEAAITSVLPAWADRSRFLEGRLCFEMGRYQEALDVFKDLETRYAGPETKEFKQTLAAWIYRSNIYLRNTGVTHEGGLDAELFEIEAAYLSGEYRKALELAEGLEKREWGERFVYVEQPDWRSGFCQCDLILFPLRDLWDRMIHTYRALALCHLTGNTGRGETSNREEAIRDMQRIMREKLLETDPNAAFYYYAYYQVLKRNGAPEVDMNTAVSIAFKRLQRRASRIDDNETKRSFLSFHYWNSALTAAAKEHKLI
ncbi:MAG: hypothetical protein LBG84_08405 [Treponema sp.]|jgi:tetratricopeptide (TPR) repeat protein|nr:hypothetical protein [Treponema sp.]